MAKLWLQSVLTLIVFTVLTGIAYPLLVTGAAQLCCRRQAEGSLLQRGGPSHRFNPHRSALRPAALLLAASLGHLATTQQRQRLERLEPRPGQSRAARCGAHARRRPAGRRSRQSPARACGPGHGLGQRPRPADQSSGRPLPGVTRRPRARYRPRSAARPWCRLTCRAASGGCSASRASTCWSSTWRWMRCTDRPCRPGRRLRRRGRHGG